MRVLVLVIMVTSLLTACTLGPNYKRPETETPEAYKEASSLWESADPKDAVPKGDWWKLFNDPTLGDLLKEARDDNQNVKAAYARVKEAHAIADVNFSAFFPTVTLNASDERSELSPNRALPPPAIPGRFFSSNYNVLLDVDYQLDIWGRLGRLFESAEAKAQAQQAIYENTILVLQTNVAQQYYTIRAYDAELDTLGKAINLRQNELDVVKARFAGKIASGLDVAQAQTQLLSVQSNALGTQSARAESEHALAVLLGKSPASFSLLPRPISDVPPPVIPAGLPSNLLERRPDIVSAEKAVVARNAEIGAAIGAFFPSISLTGSGGFKSDELHNLFSARSVAWSVLPQLSQPVFNGWLNAAQLKEAKAAYEESLAQYRQQILTAFQQVEDALSDIRLLGQQYEVQQKAVAAADTSLHLAQALYSNGVYTFINVADTEVIDLQSQLNLIEVQRRRYVASVALIESLGGGWQDNPGEDKNVKNN